MQLEFIFLFLIAFGSEVLNIFQTLGFRFQWIGFVIDCFLFVAGIFSLAFLLIFVLDSAILRALICLGFSIAILGAKFLNRGKSLEQYFHWISNCNSAASYFFCSLSSLIFSACYFIALLAYSGSYSPIFFSFLAFTALLGVASALSAWQALRESRRYFKLALDRKVISISLAR